jgi:hypothetical protein
MFGGGLFGGSLFGGSLFHGFGDEMFSAEMRTAPAGTSVHTSSSTFIHNGRKITRTTTTRRYADGREETQTDEQVSELPARGDERVRGRLRDERSHRDRDRLGY